MKNKFFVITFLGLINFSYAQDDPQKMLFNALKQQNAEQALYALREQKAKPTFLMQMEGTRTLKQVNALNFALQVYAETYSDDLLKAILNDLDVIQFSEILDYENQPTGKTPHDILSEIFPDEDPYVLLGSYIKRSHGVLDNPIFQYDSE